MRVLTEQSKRINRLSTVRVLLIQKVKSVKTVNIGEIIILEIEVFSTQQRAKDFLLIIFPVKSLLLK